VLLFKDIAFSIYFWLINTDPMANSTITNSYPNKAYLTHIIFSTKHITAFLWTLRSSSALLGGCFKHWKAHKCEKPDINHCRKNNCLHYESWNKKAKHCFAILSWLCVSDDSNFLLFWALVISKFLQFVILQGVSSVKSSDMNTLPLNIWNEKWIKGWV
jgi:hypothetical protein